MLLQLPALLPALLLRPTPAPSRAAPPCAAAAADWSRLVEGAPREANLAALEELSAAGAASLWKSAKVSPRPVSLGELSRTTKIPEAALDPTATEYSLQDIQDTFVKVVVGCTVGAVAWAAGSDALGLDAGLRFTGTYLLAGVPIGILAIGSTAPGILFCERVPETTRDHPRFTTCRHPLPAEITRDSSPEMAREHPRFTTCRHPLPAEITRDSSPEMAREHPRFTTCRHPLPAD